MLYRKKKERETRAIFGFSWFGNDLEENVWDARQREMSCTGFKGVRDTCARRQRLGEIPKRSIALVLSLSSYTVSTPLPLGAIQQPYLASTTPSLSYEVRRTARVLRLVTSHCPEFAREATSILDSSSFGGKNFFFSYSCYCKVRIGVMIRCE